MDDGLSRFAPCLGYFLILSGFAEDNGVGYICETCGCVDETMLCGRTTQRTEHLAEERGHFKQQVATLEETVLSEHMVTRKLRGVLAEWSTNVDNMAKQLSHAVTESEWALRYFWKPFVLSSRRYE